MVKFQIMKCMGYPLTLYLSYEGERRRERDLFSFLYTLSLSLDGRG
jgi:hypothetical protein